MSRPRLHPGVLVVVSDTHGRDTPRLEGRTAEAVREADLVVHAGDFLTEMVLDAFRATCDLRAVYGNNDATGVRDRLPAERVVEWAGCRIAVVHGHEHTGTALSLLAREADADLVVVGHSHRPGVRQAGEVTVLNPGSHADPRCYRPAHAELRRTDDGVAGELREPGGSLVGRLRLETG